VPTTSTDVRAADISALAIKRLLGCSKAASVGGRFHFARPMMWWTTPAPGIECAKGVIVEQRVTGGDVVLNVGKIKLFDQERRLQIHLSNVSSC
jgi:hypothetical protein